MARCKVDRTTSPTLARLIRKLSKKYRHIDEELSAIVPLIEADYTTACNGARPPKRKTGIEHWKYDFGSKDLQRSPRNSFRAVGLFLDSGDSSVERTMFLTIVFFKGDQADISEIELRTAVGELQTAINQQDLPEPTD